MARLIDLSIFKRNRAFSLIYFGQFISFIGTMITMVVLPYQVYQSTHSTMMVGMLSFVQLLPLLFTALLGGVLADRYPRRRLLLVSEGLLALGCGLLVWNAWQPVPSMPAVFVVASIMSAITGLHRPAFDGAIQQLVQGEDYKTVGALHTFEYSFCMIIGPSMAGFIVAKFGVAFTYGIDLLTYLGSITALVLLRELPIPTSQAANSVLEALQEGIQFAWKRQVLLGSYGVDFIAMVFAVPNALFPAIALSIGGVQTLGLLFAAPAVGALLISVWSGWTGSIKREGQAIAISALCWGAAMIGLGLSHSLAWALFFLALSGAFDACSGIFRVSLWNNTIPHDFRGRLAGIEMLSYLSGPKLGDTRAGIMAATLGIAPAIVIGGVFCMLGVGYCCYRMPEFWRYRAQ